MKFFGSSTQGEDWHEVGSTPCVSICYNFLALKVPRSEMDLLMK